MRFSAIGDQSPLSTLIRRPFFDMCSCAVASAAANALLRLMTRHGRLHPGLAPPVEGPIISAEAGQQTPPEEIANMRRVVAAEGSGPGEATGMASPFL